MSELPTGAGALGASPVRLDGLDGLDGLDAEATLEALVGVRRAELAVAARRLCLVARWGDLHGPEQVAGHEAALLASGVPATVIERTRERLVEAGGDGTPLVGEFAADELGCALRTSTAAARYALADAMDLRHRHPRLWALVEELVVPAWTACQVVRRTRAAGLSVAQARWVDARTADRLPGLTQGRGLELVDATIIAADPEAAEDRRRAQAQRRYASPGPVGDSELDGRPGLRSFVARTWAGEVRRFDAMVTRLAQILAENGDPDPVDARRAKAFTILATPACACRLLAQATRTAQHRAHRADPPTDSHASSGAGAEAAQRRPEEAPVDPAGETASTPPELDEPGAVAAAAAVGEWLAGVDLAALLPPATLYVHLTDTTIRDGRAGRGEGVGRVEDPDTPGGGLATTLAGITELLTGCQVTVRPVLDLDRMAPVDGYEHTPLMRAAVALRAPVEVFPYGTTPTRRADLDHTRPYVPISRGGPPGQTHPDSAGPLGRHHHRLRTHARGWRHYQPLPGLYYWRTPHGRWYAVDHDGTHDLGRTTPLLVRQLHEPATPRIEPHFAGVISTWLADAG